MATTLEDAFELPAERYITATGLLKLALSGNKIMADAGNKAILTILEHVVSGKLLLRFADEIKTKNSLLRSKCSNYLTCILTNYPPTLLEKYCTNIEDMIKIAVNDASADARSSGRNCYILYEQLFPSKANSILHCFPIATQRAIAEVKGQKPNSLIASQKISLENPKIIQNNIKKPVKPKEVPMIPKKKPKVVNVQKAVPPHIKPQKKNELYNEYDESGGVDPYEEYDQSGVEKENPEVEEADYEGDEDETQISISDLILQAKEGNIDNKRIAIEEIGRAFQNDEKDIDLDDFTDAVNVLIEEVTNSNYKVIITII